MCRFVIQLFKKSYKITIASLGGETMTGEKRQKSFLHSSLSIQYIENYMIPFKEGTHKKRHNRENVACDESFLILNMKCLCIACL